MYPLKYTQQMLQEGRKPTNGENRTISNFVINYESQVPAFKIQVAGEDKVYRDKLLYEVSNLEGPKLAIFKRT